MMSQVLSFLVVWLLNAVGVYLTAQMVPGIRVRDFSAAALAALVLGIIHLVLFKLMVILTLPLTILTLGLFYFVLVGFSFWLASLVVKGFEVDGLFAGFLGSCVLVVVNWGLGMLARGHISWW